ncbi:MAG TPA: tripartite tricarboxylate transporter substrate-binding protein [Burkholderiales bacterium]|nr:tripartite tricarboxylate transporter substrate-binding protein [Burkholderiales bacterium]
MQRFHGIAAALVVLAAPAQVVAQGYPSKPFRMIIPFPPGGATDITGRYVVHKLGVPTIAESGYPGFEVTSWWGVLVPSATSKDIVARLNAEIAKIMATPDARDRIGALDADILTTTPERFAAYIKAEQAKWGQAIRGSGARVD